MITVYHSMQFLPRTVHHRVYDAQVGHKLVTPLFVADILIANQEFEVDAHLAERLFVVVLVPIDGTGKGRMT